MVEEMRRQADWSALSQGVLIRIFENQHNALDNCAAACTCLSWRLAAQHSQVSSLYLHAHDRFYRQHWQAYLSSVSLAQYVKLTASKACKTYVPEAILKWMSRFPSVCASMHIEYCFAPSICHSSAQAGRLTSLTIQSNPSRNSLTQDLPDFRHMTKLRQLQVVCGNGRLVPNSLPACPSSLQYLALVNYEFNSYTDAPLSVLESLAPQLMILTSLQLSESLLPFCGQSFSALSSLKELSLRNSMIQC